MGRIFETCPLSTSALIQGRLPAHHELLRDGEATYERLVAEIAKAQDYVIVLYYKVADDSAGTVLKHSLVDAARRGVKVYSVFDEMGSPGLTDFRRQL